MTGPDPRGEYELRGRSARLQGRRGKGTRTNLSYRTTHTTLHEWTTRLPKRKALGRWSRQVVRAIIARTEVAGYRQSYASSGFTGLLDPLFTGDFALG